MIVDAESGVGLTVSIFLGERVFTACWRLEHPIERTVVGVRGTTVEVTLHKVERGLQWQRLSVTGEESTTALSEREPLYREGTLVSVEEVTHNTKLFTFRLPAGSYLSVPVGHHIKLRGMLEGVCSMQAHVHHSTDQHPHTILMLALPHRYALYPHRRGGGAKLHACQLPWTHPLSPGTSAV